MQGWKEANVSFNLYVRPGDEIDEEMYDYFLEVVPPILHNRYEFLNGEPVCRDFRGRTLYGWFIERPVGMYYYQGLIAKELLFNERAYFGEKP